MAARVERWNAEVAPIAAQPLGTNVRRLTRNRGGESALGNFVTDAMREASGVDVAMQNSGGLRADLPEGPVTRGTIFEVMPFDNRVFTLELTGAELKLALEQALRSERVTQVSGIRYQFDLGKPALQRIESLTLADGRPLDLAARYKVAVNDFMATGGDDYDVLSGGKNRRETDIEVREALEERVARLTREGKPIDYAPEGRIERVGATRPRRENN
jgi:2',3'-cyclic-nucleotide 2'-phosphodiesterase/3'-nucleotidase